MNTANQELLVLLDCMAKGSTQPNKQIRETAEMAIYEFQTRSGYLKMCFEILELILNEPTHPKAELYKSVVIVNISRYVTKQFTEGNNVRKQSRMELFSVYSAFLRKFCAQQSLSDHFLRQLVESFSTMLVCQNNRTLTLNYIAELGDDIKTHQNNIIANCYLLSSVIKASKNDASMTAKTYARCGEHLLSYFLKIANDARVLEVGLHRMALLLVCEQLIQIMKLLTASKFLPAWTSIFRNQVLFETLMEMVRLNDKQLVNCAYQILKVAFDAEQQIKIRAVTIPQKIKVRMMPQVLNGLKTIVGMTDNFDKLSVLDLALLKSYFGFGVHCVKPLANMTFLNSKKQEILFDIILPCMKPTQCRLLIDEPTEYFNKKADLSNQQKSQTLECLAAKFLQAMCDWVDGMVTFICDWSIETMQAVNGGQLKDVYVNNRFYQTTKQTVQIQMALLCLTITSYSYSGRKDIKKSLNQALITSLHAFFNPVNPELYIQFNLMWTYNSDMLFDNENLPTLIERLLQILMIQDSLQAVRLSTCETLIDLMSSDRYVEIFKTHTTVILEILMKLLMEGNDCKKIFEMIRQMFKLYSKEIIVHPKIIEGCLQAIGLRVRTAVSQNTGTTDTFVLCCFDWFETLIEHIQYKNYADQMMETVAPAYYLNQENSYLDRLIILATKYMKQTLRVPDCVEILIINAQRIIEMYRGKEQQVIGLLNNIIGYTHKQEHILLLLKICSQNMSSQLLLHQSTNPAPYVTLLHLMLSLHFPHIPGQALSVILTKTCSAIQSQYIKRTYKQAYTLYLLILLEFMKRYIQSTVFYMKSAHLYESMMDALYEGWAVYQGEFPSKVFVVVQMDLVTNQMFDNNYVDRSLQMIIMLLKIRYQKKHGDDEDQEQDNSNSGLSDSDDSSNEQKQSLTPLLTCSPYNKSDEIVCFQRLVQQIQQNQATLRYFVQLVNNLPLGLRSFVTKEVMSLVNVDKGDGQKEVRKILRVVRGKGTQME